MDEVVPHLNPDANWDAFQWDVWDRSHVGTLGDVIKVNRFENHRGALANLENPPNFEAVCAWFGTRANGYCTLMQAANVFSRVRAERPLVRRSAEHRDDASIVDDQVQTRLLAMMNAVDDGTLPSSVVARRQLAPVMVRDALRFAIGMHWLLDPRLVLSSADSQVINLRDYPNNIALEALLWTLRAYDKERAVHGKAPPAATFVPELQRKFSERGLTPQKAKQVASIARNDQERLGGREKSNE